jgi:hypothetical protein
MNNRMFASLFAVIAATVAAQTGPSALYTLLNGQTFNPPGYTIVMYQSCMQNQNAGNPCGSFSGYQSSNGQYTYQLYGPEAAVSPTCSRTFKLTLACGPTLQMSGVNENPTCVYSATLSLPQVCGVDLTVGNEIASVSPTALPPTVSPTTTTSLTATPTITASGTATTTLTLTATASVTSTPLFQITAWPTTSSTTTLTATSTPLFMITAWPTSSPVNVSATSTPLYYYTAYPSVGSNATGGLLDLAASLTSSTSSTAVILGSVALGIVGIGAIGGAIAYFRKGGSVKGLMAKIEENKGAMTQFANALPISAENKAKLTGAIADPTSLLPPEAKEMAEKAKAQVEALQAQAQGVVAQAQAMNQSVLAALPPQLASVIQAKQDQLQTHVTSVIQAKQEELKGQLQGQLPSELVTLLQSNPQLASIIQANQELKVPLQSSLPLASIIQSTQELVRDAVNSFEPTSVAETVVTAVAETVATHIDIKPEDVEAVKAFLTAKNVTAQPDP